MLPEDLESKAQALSWMSFLASTVHGARADGEEARAAFHLAARRLGDRDWCWRLFRCRYLLFRLFGASPPALNSRPGEFPTLEAHGARVLARPAVIKTLAAETEISFWFQQMGSPRTGRNRFHIDIYVPHDQVQARIDAALAAGGRIVNDAHAPGWWTLADPEGNEADLAIWQKRP